MIVSAPVKTIGSHAPEMKPIEPAQRGKLLPFNRQPCFCLMAQKRFEPCGTISGVATGEWIKPPLLKLLLPMESHRTVEINTMVG